jgi:hypothetical protein
MHVDGCPGRNNADLTTDGLDCGQEDQEASLDPSGLEKHAIKGPGNMYAGAFFTRRISILRYFPTTHRDQSPGSLLPGMSTPKLTHYPNFGTALFSHYAP